MQGLFYYTCNSEDFKHVELKIKNGCEIEKPTSQSF